jgi:phosphoribosylformylglycinamidine synthase subunit PurQ / glutaminase
VSLVTSSPTVAIVVFPGTWSERDFAHVAESVLGWQVRLVWHTEVDVGSPDAVVLPGGFAHGDHLRTGAIARFSPIMSAVAHFAARGGPVLGICNGFQILLEAGLLPGAMVRNRSVKFISQHVHVRVEHRDTPFSGACHEGQVLRLPIAHGEGNYFAEPETLRELEANRQVIFRYTNDRGDVTDLANVNGSINNIAGICNRERNVVGLMPHPERACEDCVGSADGRLILASAVEFFADRLVTT